MTSDAGFSPSLSTDGRLVIYSRWTSLGVTLWQVPIGGGEPQQFSKIFTAANAAFSPEGKQMAFRFTDKEYEQTCVAAIDADAPEKCFGISRSFSRWAPDGKTLFYLDHGYKGIWKQPLNGNRVLFLEFPGERTNNFAFSHDGKQLVVARSIQTHDIVALTDER